MTEHDLTVLAVFANIIIIAVMLVSGTWVAFDARKRGRPVTEVIAWFFFATMFILVGPLVYVYFRKNFYQ